MDYLVLTITGFIGGAVSVLILLTNAFSINNNQLLEASAMCAVNGDLVEIRTGFESFVAVCGNGAEFKLKEK